MSGSTYAALATLAQQGGAIYFCILFAFGAAYAFWPRNKERFERAARAPLEEESNP
jgi:cytochrome c oxidase cbb3-type subunit IV